MHISQWEIAWIPPPCSLCLGVRVRATYYTQYGESGTVRVGRYQNSEASNGTLDIKIPSHMGHYFNLPSSNTKSTVMVSQKQKICEHWWSQYCVHIVKVVSILNSGNQDTYLFIKPGKSDWDKSWDIDIKIRGKIVGHWYQKFDGVPLSPYCV